MWDECIFDGCFFDADGDGNFSPLDAELIGGEGGDGLGDGLDDGLGDSFGDDD